jgi:uncharacterized protein involved in outer membrane biogenesis
MSVFKSPLLLLGILVILVAGSALVAPYFIDWGSYRSEFEKYGKRLTGRDTRVLGDITVRLFPWPRMLVRDVRIANPPGAMLEEFFRADELDVRLALAPLISGKLKVESVEINRPVFGFERMATGKGTWEISQKGLGEIFGADDIAVAGISITNGTIVLADGKRRGTAQLDGFNAVISARSLSGPWKLRGEAVVQDEGVSIIFNTGKWRKDRPLKFSLRLAPTDSAGLTYSFDGIKGIGKNSEIRGKLKILPTANKKGKTDALADFRPIGFRAELTANFDTLNFSKIEIAPINAVDVQTFVTGKAQVKLGSIIRVKSSLKAARLDLDSLLGIRGRKTVRSIKSLDALAGFVEALPENIQLQTQLDVTSLVVAGEPLDGMQLDFEVFGTTLKVNQLSVLLPGQTKALFSGSLIAGEAQPQLLGDIRLDSVAVKDFAKWAGADYRREIEQIWSGTRGRLKLSGKVDLSRGNFRFRDGRFSLDESTGTVGFSAVGGDNPLLAFEIVSDDVDLDRYAPEGLFRHDDIQSLPERIIDNIAGLVGERDINLSAKLGTLKMNGVVAKGVVVEFLANENSVDFRRIKFSEVGDASLDFSGVVKFSDETVSGSLNGQLKAENPSSMLKLIGYKDLPDEWLRAVSPVDFTVTGNADAGEVKTKGNVEVSGQVGKTIVSGVAKFDGKVSDWQSGQLHLSGQLRGKSARAMLDLFGLKLKPGPDTEGRLAITATGTMKDGLASTADAEMFGVNSQFSGTVKKDDIGPVANGRLAVLVENTDKIFSVFGLDVPKASELAKVFSGEGQVEVRSSAIRLQKARGTAAGTSFFADLEIKPQNKPVSFKLDVSTGQLSLPFLLGSSLLERNGRRYSLATRFSPDAFGNVDGTMAIRSKRFELWPGFTFSNGKASIVRKGRKIDIAATGKRDGGGQVTFTLNADVGRQISRIIGKLKVKAQALQFLVSNNQEKVLGGMVAGEMTFAGSGRTPGGLLAGLSGNGQYSIADGVLKNLSPVPFAAQLPQAKTAKDVEQLVRSQLRTGDMGFVESTGKIEVANGVMTFQPLPIKGPGATGSLKAIFEIANGLLDLSFRLKLENLKELPGFEIAFAGPPFALAPSSDFSALKSHITAAAIKKDFERMEELAREQQRLIEEEKKQRAELEARRKEQREAKQLLRKKQQELLKQSEESKTRREVKKPVELSPLPEVITPTPAPRPKPVQRPKPQVEALPPPIVVHESPILPPVADPPLFPSDPPPVTRKKVVPPPRKNWRQEGFESTR